MRLLGGFLVPVAVLIILYALVWSPYGQSRRYESDVIRQGYALGFGLGQYLKQTQPGHNLAILLDASVDEFEQSAHKGLKDGLEGALPIVAERSLDTTTATDFHTLAELFTKELLASFKAAGADIVVSFPGLPMRIYEGEDGGLDLDATQELWKSPEYSGLQWVLTDPPDPWPPGLFREGRVLAFVREKPQTVKRGEVYPAYLQIKGTPSELFNAWFELVTTDEVHQE
jgi:hypothetical protein